MYTKYVLLTTYYFSLFQSREYFTHDPLLTPGTNKAEYATPTVGLSRSMDYWTNLLPSMHTSIIAYTNVPIFVSDHSHKTLLRISFKIKMLWLLTITYPTHNSVSLLNLIHNKYSYESLLTSCNYISKNITVHINRNIARFIVPNSAQYQPKFTLINRLNS